MRETRCHAICLFDYDEEDRRAEHEEATKTPVPLILPRMG
jgi:hypothetical protein